MVDKYNQVGSLYAAGRLTLTSVPETLNVLTKSRVRLRDCRTGGFRGPAWILSMLENLCDAGVFAAKWHMDHMTE